MDTDAKKTAFRRDSATTRHLWDAFAPAIVAVTILVQGVSTDITYSSGLFRFFVGLVRHIRCTFWSFPVILLIS